MSVVFFLRSLFKIVDFTTTGYKSESERELPCGRKHQVSSIELGGM
jgi:hypothetical protein